MDQTKYRIQHSAYLVNVAAHLFSVGDDESAYSALKRALSVLQLVANDFDERITEQVGDPFANNLCSLPPALPFDCEDPATLILGTPEREDKSYYYVYRQPFVMDPLNLDISYTPVYLAIVIFDMTLLLLNKAQKEHIKVSLAKALRLYDLALRLLRNAPSNFGSHDVRLALLNNKIHVCYCLHRFEEAHETLEVLTAALGLGCYDETIFDELELNEMTVNTLLPLDPTKLAPAA